MVENNAAIFTAIYLEELAEILQRVSVRQVEDLIEALSQAQQHNRRVFIAGVGGSAGNASHMAADFRKFLGLAAFSVSENVSEITALANDVGWDECYQRSLMASGLSKFDVLMILSVGGGSRLNQVSVNLVVAAEYAREVGASILSIVGRDGGDVLPLSDVAVCIPIVESRRVTAHTETMQAVLWHLLISHPKLSLRPGRWESLETD